MLDFDLNGLREILIHSDFFISKNDSKHLL